MILKPLRIRPPRLELFPLEPRMQVLRDLAQKNRDRGFSDGELTGASRKEELLRILSGLPRDGKGFHDSTDVPLRQRLLLSIYFDEYGKQEPQIPEFSNMVAQSILGVSGVRLKPSVQRLAAYFYFRYYTRLPPEPRAFLARRILESFDPKNMGLSGTENWFTARERLFGVNAPLHVARFESSGWSVAEICAKNSIPEGSDFAKELQVARLFYKLETCALGEIIEECDEIVEHKKTPSQDGLPLGAAALRILIGRVIDECEGSWPGKWNTLITKFASDPRRNATSNDEHSRWWSWTDSNQLRVAVRGMTGLTLSFFLRFLERSLEGAEYAYQFPARRDFIEELQAAGVIEDAKLYLCDYAYFELDNEQRKNPQIGRLNGGGQTSVLCLRCERDIYLVDGTSNFALRVFVGSFPINNFWPIPPSKMGLERLKLSQRQCSFFFVHDQFGYWKSKFFQALRRTCRIEWEV
jgi:hypothetical protein